MGMCKTRSINTSARYYFNEVEDTINGSAIESQKKGNSIASMEQRVSLIISLKNVETNNSYKVELITYFDTQRNASKSAGFTETLSRNQNNNEINFEKFFALPYFFEKQQLLDFRIYNGEKFETLQTSLGSIMGSRKQTLKKKLSDGIEININGKEIKKSNKVITFNVKLNGDFIGMGLSYTIINQGTQTNPSSVKLYDSEILTTKTGSVIFGKCSIPVMFLNPSGNAEENIVSIEINDSKHKKILGKYKGAISKLLIPDNFEVSLNHNNKASIKCIVVSIVTFISYLRSGMVINLTIGIDFTCSNDDYKRPSSLHYLFNGMNDYEKAIRSCGDILAYYDNDQLFPVFGFGFNFLDGSENQFTEKYTKFNFPINCNVDNPEINTIDNVLAEYRRFITKIDLDSPTYFAPIINDLNKETAENLQKGQMMNYNILMILTDGVISDLKETIDALVEASYLPISVIIIGIGNENFENMNVLDADENPLYDKQGRKADRDLVQFVPFNDYKNDPQKLAEQVLEEIPRQIVEYYQHRKIQPIDEDGDNSSNSTNFNSQGGP